MGEIEKTSTTVDRNHPGLRRIARDIAYEHNAVGRALGSAVEHAIKAGGLLNEVKKQLPHGEWLPWLGANFGGSVRTANNYMRCAKNRTAIRKMLGENDGLTVSTALEELTTPRERPSLEAAAPNSQAPANLEKMFREERERSKPLRGGDVVPDGHLVEKVFTPAHHEGYDADEDPKDRKIRELEERIERQTTDYALHIGDLYQRFGAKPPQTLSEVFNSDGSGEAEEDKKLNANWQEYGIRRAAQKRKEKLGDIYRTFQHLYLSGILDENLQQYAVRPVELADYVLDEAFTPFNQELEGDKFEQVGGWLLQVAKEIREYRSGNLRALPPPADE